MLYFNLSGGSLLIKVTEGKPALGVSRSMTNADFKSENMAQRMAMAANELRDGFRYKSVGKIVSRVPRA